MSNETNVRTTTIDQRRDGYDGSVTMTFTQIIVVPKPIAQPTDAEILPDEANDMNAAAMRILRRQGWVE